jgi:phosphoglycerate-specific signal transduction histidine kinase
MLRLIPVLFAFLLGGFHGAAMAQAMPEQAQAEQEQEAEDERVYGELSESDVEAFAEVHYQVRRLERDFAQQLRNRGEDDDPAEMQREMTRERMALIKDAGLTSERYRQILGAVARNEELRSRVEALEADYRENDG